MKDRLVTRKKTLVVPYILREDGNHLMLLVQDARSQEYAFVTGGCKLNEHPLECAQRELKEETNGLFRLYPDKHPIYVTSFETFFRPIEHKLDDQKRHILVKTLYQLVFFPVAENAYRHHMRKLDGNPEVTRLRFFTQREIERLLYQKNQKNAVLSPSVHLWQDLMNIVFPHVYAYIRTL